MVKKKKKKNKHILSKILISICFILIIILGILAGICKAKYDGQVKKMIIDISNTFLGKAEPIYVLLVGISEDISTELSDTIILCGYNPEDQNAFMLSIPRDTFVGKSTSSASGNDKINTCYRKGIDNLKQKVKNITGIEIDYYAVVRTSMLIKIVDTIGGVNFEVPIDMNYDDPTQNLHIHLEKGYQKIDGQKAEQLLRFRHNNNYTSYPSSYGDNDFGRMKTQREFIKTVAKQTINIKNTFKIKKLLNNIYDNLETNLEKDKLVPYIAYALDFDTENIRMEQLPGASATYNGLSFFDYSKSSTKKLMDEIENLMTPTQNNK